MTEPAATLTYSALVQALSTLGERAKKHRKNSSPVIPRPGQAPPINRAYDNVIRDAEELLLSLRQYTMNSRSASSRVAEAQAFMNLAGIEKAAGNVEGEAAAYCRAANLWIAVEAERRDANMSTMSDALARGVLCAAVACNVLLSQPASAKGGSPLPVKMTKLQPHPHLSRCWLILMRVAHTLVEFGCLEMAADYFELAAIVVTTDVKSILGNEKRDAAAAATGLPPQPLQNASFTPFSRTHVDPNASFASGTSTAQNQARRLRSMLVEGSTSDAAGGALPASSSPSGRSRATASTACSVARGGVFVTHRRLNAAFYGEDKNENPPTQQSMTAARDIPVGLTGASLPPQWVANSDPLLHRLAVTNTAAARRLNAAQLATSSVIVTGFLSLYMDAMLQCATVALLMNDTVRGLSMLDELLLHLIVLEKQRRPQLRPAWEGQRNGPSRKSRHTELEPEDAMAATDGDSSVQHALHDGEGQSAAAAIFPRPAVPSPTADGDNLVMMDSLPSDVLSSSAVAVAAAPATHHSNSEQDSASVSTPLPSSQPSTILTQGGRRRVAAMGLAPKEGAAGQQQPLHGQADGRYWGPVAPTPGGSLHAHPQYTPSEHAFLLDEISTAFLTANVAKFFVLVALRDPQLLRAAREPIQHLLEFGMLLREHQRQRDLWNAMKASTGTEGSASPAGDGANPFQNNHSSSSGSREVASPVGVVLALRNRLPVSFDTSIDAMGTPTTEQQETVRPDRPPTWFGCMGQTVISLAVILEAILETVSLNPAARTAAGGNSSASDRQTTTTTTTITTTTVSLLRVSVAEVERLLEELGCRSRDMSIIMERTVRAMEFQAPIDVTIALD